MGELVPVVRTRPGLVVAAGASLAVNVDGTLMTSAWWPAGYIPAAGDAVRVLLVDGAAQVLGPVITGPRPGQGNVSGAATGGLVPVTAGTVTLQCRYTGTAPTIGSLVFLDWQSTTPRIMAGAAATVPTPEPGGNPDTPTPPPVDTTGTLNIPATGSGSWQVGGTWAWAGTDVYQWRYGSNRENRGAWFYGSAPTQLAGRTITGLRIRLGSRLRIGSYNTALVAHLYLTADRGQPGGDVTRTQGPVDVTIPAGAGPMWVDLPAAWGQTLANSGGGIALLGSPYLGFTGIGGDPASGQLALDWRR